MNPSKRQYDFYLEDILTSMLRINEYIGEREFLEFKQNYMIVDAVVRNFEIIGEASKNVPEEIQKKYPEIPWKKMYGLRNLISHEYFGIDYEMIWQIATANLPQNVIDLQKIIESEKNTNGNIR
ncbi:MAG: DUF86 domain-containing protein [Bacteroidales bacterium]|nr:DUF86 domain-containing protein [Bacteroidales bacterium]